MKAQAHLICGRMQIALGKPEDSVPCQRHVFEVLKNLPETNRITQLSDALESLITASKEENRFRGKSFEDFVAQIDEGPAPEAAPPAPEAPADSAADAVLPAEPTLADESDDLFGSPKSNR